MNEKEWLEKLEKEGFRDIFVWEDEPNAYYPPHTHPELAAHVILSGEMTLTTHGKEITVKAGERFDVKAGEIHAAKIGPQGSKYLVGRK